MTTRFYLIRHGVCDPVGKHIAGRAPGVHLNAEGREQVQRLAEEFARRYRVDAIYASPLERTMETAAALSAQIRLPIIAREGLLEVDFGEWTGVSFDELRTQKLWKEYNRFRSGVQIPGGEQIPQMQARVLAELHSLRMEHLNQDVVVVAHGDVVKAAVAHYAGSPLDLLLRFEISPASVSIVEVGNWGAKIHLVNGTF